MNEHLVSCTRSAQAPRQKKSMMSKVYPRPQSSGGETDRHGVEMTDT